MNEIDNFKHRVQQYAQENENLKRQAQNISIYEDDLRNLSTEIERLNHVLEIRTK